MAEFHTNFDSPAACDAGIPDGVTAGRMLQKLWVNDSLAVAYLEETYPGLPVEEFNFTRSAESGEIETITYRWGRAIDDLSEFTVRRRADQAVDGTDNVRAFWWNATAVGAMDFLTDFKSADQAAVALWDLREPMLRGPVVEQGVARVAVFDSSSSTLGLTLFKDHQCSQVYE